MRLDHVSYVTSHDQLADTVQRLGSRLGSTFVDGGIHPRFGTRNFTASLKNGQYIEVVCPLDHPATEQTPWGKAVSKKANEGGGWFTWVFSTKDIAPIATKFGREATEGHRTRPNGTDLKWKQIGVKEITETPGVDCVFIGPQDIAASLGYIANPRVQFGANCYGYKPRMTNEEKELMLNTEKYPKNLKDVAMEKRVDYWKEKISDILVSPFNHDTWSKL
jgi:hypothetical protein